MLAWLGLDAAYRREHWAEWLNELLKGDGAPRAVSVFAAKKLAEKHPSIPEALSAEQDRIVAIEDSRRALRVAQASTALLRLAKPVLQAYAGRKQDMGFLDYGDLIGRTSRLLVDPGAAWVLYKLDGGIDHLLLDEVQDTAPEQWQIAHRLTEEFFAGQGARAEQVEGRGAPARPVFAVGEPPPSRASTGSWAPIPRFSGDATTAWPPASAVRRRSGAMSRWTCRSARPSRCLT